MSVKRKLLFAFGAIFFLIASAIVWKAYDRYRAPMVHITEELVYFYIPTGSDYADVKTKLFDEGLLADTAFFQRLVELKNYQDQVKPGRYLIKNKMTAAELIDMLRAGHQAPVRLTFNNIRFLSKFAGIIGKKLEIDSAEFMVLMNDNVYLDSLGFNNQTVISLFLPNTYEIYWNITAREFIKKMHKEYKKFWTEKRIEQAASIPLNPIQVSILASIVQEETNKMDEMSLMAGVLINRLNRGVKLQADPTARFAYGDFSVQRITSNYTSIESPYNTYYVFGLPPGPICMPEQRVIDAVLNYEKSDNMYYCAKSDGSGYHAFSVNLAEHQRNASAYHRYLKKLKINR